jgi:hypothetical protein
MIRDTCEFDDNADTDDDGDENNAGDGDCNIDCEIEIKGW